MKGKIILLMIVLTISIFAGCSPTPSNNAGTTTAGTTTTTPAPATTTAPATTSDVTTTASLVNTEAAFEKAIGSNGTWIISTLKDLTFTKDLVLTGEFKNGKKDADGKDIIQRKIALYAQDDQRNVTARYTLTAPKLTIQSPEASLQHGVFKGDLYVSVKNFQLVDQTVEGNVYFTTDEAKNTFKMDATSKVTGKQELKKP